MEVERIGMRIASCSKLAGFETVEDGTSGFTEVGLLEEPFFRCACDLFTVLIKKKRVRAMRDKVR